MKICVDILWKKYGVSNENSQFHPSRLQCVHNHKINTSFSFSLSSSLCFTPSSSRLSMWMCFLFHLQRRCRFNSDFEHNATELYFRSNCIGRCRLKSIIALCNCHPFYIEDSAVNNSTKACTLDRLPCLNDFSGIFYISYFLFLFLFLSWISCDFP